MKILFIIPTLGTGGAERVASILANYLSENNKVEIFVMEKSDTVRYPIKDKVSINEAGINVKRGKKIKVIINFAINFWRQRDKLKSEINKFKPNVIISFLPKADILTASVKKNCKWIGSERNDPMSRSSIERNVLNLIYKKTDMLICQTQKVADYYLVKKVKKTCVIRNPLILEEATPFSNKENYIISVGRLDKQKNYPMLIRAFTKAKKTDKFTEKLYIVGAGPQQAELQNLINSLKMEQEIMLLGRKSNVRKYLNKAKAFILSSDYEGLPNAMLEAMDAGLPIISTDFFTGAAREFVDEENGYIVPIGDISKMAKAIEELLGKQEEQLEQMGVVSKQRVKKMGVEEISQEWEKIIRVV